jgi:hypothetical protein
MNGAGCDRYCPSNCRIGGLIGRGSRRLKVAGDEIEGTGEVAMLRGCLLQSQIAERALVDLK